VLPPADTDKAKKVYQEMAQQLAFDPRAGLGA
jgi:curved DNA-binding protein